jgi:hypothetical protein
MKRTLDVLYVKDTGHVLTIAARAGEDEGPKLEVLAGPGLSYPLALDHDVVDVGLPAGLDKAKLAVPLDDGNADALFQREVYSVTDGKLQAGLGDLSDVTFSGGQVTLKLPTAPAAELAYVIVGVPAAGGTSSAQPGKIPVSASTSYLVPQTFTDAAKVLVFVKGFKPRMK